MAKATVDDLAEAAWDSEIAGTSCRLFAAPLCPGDERARQRTRGCPLSTRWIASTNASGTSTSATVSICSATPSLLVSQSSPFRAGPRDLAGSRVPSRRGERLLEVT